MIRERVVCEDQRDEALKALCTGPGAQGRLITLPGRPRALRQVVQRWDRRLAWPPTPSSGRPGGTALVTQLPVCDANPGGRKSVPPPWGPEGRNVDVLTSKRVPVPGKSGWEGLPANQL